MDSRYGGWRVVTLDSRVVSVVKTKRNGCGGVDSNVASAVQRHCFWATPTVKGVSAVLVWWW